MSYFEEICSEFANKKLYAHVIFVSEENVAEIVATFTEGNVIKDGFTCLESLVRDYCSNSEDSSVFNIIKVSEPGCNEAIFIVELEKCNYQLNFVEVK